MPKSKGPFVIYGLSDPRTGEVRYIGKSTTGWRRIMLHGRALDNTRKGHKQSWLKNLRADGLEHEAFVLVECDPEDLCDAEIFWIALGRHLGWPLTNMATGGEGNSSAMSAETKSKISAKLKGRPRGPFTDETRARMSAASKLRGAPVLSAESRAKLSASKMGHEVTAETRAKISATKKGKPVPADTDRMRKAAAKRAMSPEEKSAARSAYRRDFARRQAEMAARAQYKVGGE